MFNDPRDFNRDVNYRDPGYVAPADEVGWGLPIAILAVIVIVGGLFFYGYSDRTQTAQYEPPATHSTPAIPPSPATPGPAPRTAPPQR
jgi:hypothetical protein